MIHKRSYKRFAAICFVFITVLCVFGGCTLGSKSVRLGTGNMGGTYYQYGEQLSKVDSDVVLKTTAGSEANLRLLDKGFIDAAIVQSDSLDISGYNIAALTGLYTETVQLIVRKDSGIGSVSQLVGKRVSVGEKDSGVIRNATQVLLAAGITLDDISVQNLSFTESAEALKKGDIDAFFCTAGVPTTAIKGLFDTGQVDIIGLEEDLLKRLLNLYPGYNEVVVPAGTYTNQSNEVHTIGVRAVLVVSPTMSDEVAQTLIEEVFDNSKSFNANIVTDGEIDAEHAVLSVGVPFHPAAAKYLESKGVSVAKWSGSNKKAVFGSQDN